MFAPLHGHGAMPASPLFRSADTTGPSRGDRIVARNDADGDGALSLTELADTKLGKRLSVDQFARLDGNGDSMLDASELNAMRRRHHHGSFHQMSVPAMMADYLAGPVDPKPPSDEIAERLIARLDADASGALNSEEIAGTRLASVIGDGFYALDADQSGTLDQAELGGFIAEKVLGLADPAAASPPADAGGATAEAETAAAVAEPDLAVTEDPASLTQGPAETAAAAPADPESGAVQYQNAVRTAFETALETLKSGSEANSVDVVSDLYTKVQSILQPA